MTGGGGLDHAKWGSRAFYDQVLEHADEREVATLTNELASTPFPDALVLSADAKEHVNGARIYFISLGLLTEMGAITFFRGVWTFGNSTE